jgi:hypothetical protein
MRPVATVPFFNGDRVRQQNGRRVESFLKLPDIPSLFSRGFFSLQRRVTLKQRLSFFSRHIL